MQEIDPISYALGATEIAATQVQRGTRPVVDLTVFRDALPRVEGVLSSKGLRYLIYDHTRAHAMVYVFREPHMADVVRFINGETQEGGFALETVREWATGKVFGLSEGEIAAKLRDGLRVAPGYDPGTP